jgi:hypothetical protein
VNLNTAFENVPTQVRNPPSDRLMLAASSFTAFLRETYHQELARAIIATDHRLAISVNTK